MCCSVVGDVVWLWLWLCVSVIVCGPRVCVCFDFVVGYVLIWLVVIIVASCLYLLCLLFFVLL